MGREQTYTATSDGWRIHTYADVYTEPIRRRPGRVHGQQRAELRPGREFTARIHDGTPGGTLWRFVFLYAAERDHVIQLVGHRPGQEHGVFHLIDPAAVVRVHRTRTTTGAPA